MGVGNGPQSTMANINTKTIRGSGPTDVKEQRVISDAVMKERHAGFDLSAQDNHMKYERASFVVVTSSEAYRNGWEETFGTQQDGTDEGRGQGSSGESTVST